ncbi:MAG: hypothetical protein KC731_12445 [Myxococcales bacterium]|nr:hypothetical protein [Myxococcales bacterium]
MTDVPAFGMCVSESCDRIVTLHADYIAVWSLLTGDEVARVAFANPSGIHLFEGIGCAWAGNKIIGFQVDDGKVDWSLVVPSADSVISAMTDGREIVARTSNSVNCYCPGTSRTAWRHAAEPAVDGVLFVGGRLYLSDGQVVANGDAVATLGDRVQGAGSSWLLVRRGSRHYLRDPVSGRYIVVALSEQAARLVGAAQCLVFDYSEGVLAWASSERVYAVDVRSGECCLDWYCIGSVRDICFVERGLAVGAWNELTLKRLDGCSVSPPATAGCAVVPSRGSGRSPLA